MDNQRAISEEARGAMLANLQLELNSRKDKLRAQYEAQCSSLQSRLERRVNRIPAIKRQMSVMNLLNGPLPAQSGPGKATSVKLPPAQKPSIDTSAPAAPVRRTRAAPTTQISKLSAAQEELRPTSNSATGKPAVKPKPVKGPKTTRAKKRSSEEISSEDKENTAELAVSRKRLRAAAPKAASVTKPATSARTTRAASRTKPAQVLSPKNDNANTRTKPTTRNTRPR